MNEKRKPGGRNGECRRKGSRENHVPRAGRRQNRPGPGVWLLDGFGENGRPKSDDNLYSPPGFTIRVSSPGSLHCTPLPVEGARAAAPGGVPVTLTRCSIRRGPFAPAERAPDGLSNMPAGHYGTYTASFTLNGTKHETAARQPGLEDVIRPAASVTGAPSGGSITAGGSREPSTDRQAGQNIQFI